MRKILIVGDFETFLEMDKNILSRENCLMLASSSAEGAIDIHKREFFDLIITDYGLPGMDGAELCEYIRKHMTLKKVSILLLCDDDTQVDRAGKCGSNDHLMRPFGPEDLNAKISELLDIADREGKRVLLRSGLSVSVDEESFETVPEDISKTGIAFRTERFMEEGSKVLIVFKLGDDDISVRGEVVRIKEESSGDILHGAQFVDLDPETKSIIEEYVNSH